MSDHEFEKQVHQKLEQLKLRPSDTVWMEVQKNIREDKRRRRFLWLWVPLLCICLTTSGYILYSYTFNTKNTPAAAVAKAIPAAESSKTIAETSNNSTQQSITPEKPVSENSGSTHENAVAGLPPQTDSKQPVLTTPQATAATAATLPGKQQPATVTVKGNTANNETIGLHNKKRVKKPLAIDDGSQPLQPGIADYRYTHEKHFTAKKNAVNAKGVKNETAAQQEQLAPPASAAAGGLPQTMPERDGGRPVTIPVMVNEADNSIATNKAAATPFNNQPLLLSPDSNTQTTAAMPIPRKRRSLWHWGIVTDAGFSRIAESKLFQLRGLLGTEKYLAEDLAARSYSSPVNNNAFLQSGVTAATSTKKASPIQPDFAFSAGVFVQRTLSPRFKLSLGLEYSYMSVNTQVGQKVDAPIVVNVGTTMAAYVPEYYKNAGYDATSVTGNFTGAYNSQKYRYRFQYLEIPLMANWQINKGRRMPPLVFEGGFSLARLLSVKALHYEGIKGVYYQDNELFNKTQFNFVTGLSAGLLQKSKHPIWVGPHLRYALNGLVNKQVSSGQYLWSTGITVKMLLGRL